MPTSNQTHTEKLSAFATLVQEQRTAYFDKAYPGEPPHCFARDSIVHVRPGKVYTKVDVGTSGKYMVDQAGTIFGIKGYGQVNKSHTYGTLDTIDKWNWGGHYAVSVSGTQP